MRELEVRTGEGRRNAVTSVRALLRLWTGWVRLPYCAQEASVTAELSPNPVGVDEQVSLTITVVGGGAERPQIPKINGLKLVGGPSVSNQFQWINGQSSSSQSFTYVLLPEAEGTVKVPAIAVRANGKTYHTARDHAEGREGRHGTKPGAEAPQSFLRL